MEAPQIIYKITDLNIIETWEFIANVENQVDKAWYRKSGSLETDYVDIKYIIGCSTGLEYYKVKQKAIEDAIKMLKHSIRIETEMIMEYEKELEKLK